MLYRISVTERGLTGIANIFRSRLSRLDDLLGAGTVPLNSNFHATNSKSPDFDPAFYFLFIYYIVILVSQFRPTVQPCSAARLGHTPSPG